MSLTLVTPGNAIVDECIRLRKSVQPISEKYNGLLEKSSLNNTKYPFVLLLGNHSSGKSSFINYVLNRKIQSTGVAPTDDCFTIIGSGAEDSDKNGPALVGDPDLGFSSLQTFGTSLVNHTQLKIRSGVSIKDFMIVDSPGMIDSPGMTAQHSSGSSNNKMDRGYNFEGVCRWYAERADVILLFFDPDKPGTTGETLSILTNSLVGLDHKLHIILNKADQFKKIHDFARAYGSLCWNLSKVIQRKDLPRIHTMCLPATSIADETASSKSTVSEMAVTSAGERSPMRRGDSGEQITEKAHLPPLPHKSFFDHGRSDLEEARDEVVREVFNAPRRRVDNEISRLSDSIQGLLMHCNIVDHIVSLYHSKLWRGRALVGLTGLVSIGLTFGSGYLFDWLSSWPAGSVATAPVAAAPTTTSGPKVINAVPNTGGARLTPPKESFSHMFIATLNSARHSLYELFHFHSKQSLYIYSSVCGVLLTGGAEFYRCMTLTKDTERLTSRTCFEESFRHLYSNEIAKKDLYTCALGELVIENLLSNFSPLKLESAVTVKKEDKVNLARIVSDDVANLRRRAAPNFPLLSPQTTPLQHKTNIWSSGNQKPLFRSTESLQGLHRNIDTDLGAPVLPHIFSSNYDSPAKHNSTKTSSFSSLSELVGLDASLNESGTVFDRAAEPHDVVDSQENVQQSDLEVAVAVAMTAAEKRMAVSRSIDKNRGIAFARDEQQASPLELSGSPDGNIRRSGANSGDSLARLVTESDSDGENGSTTTL